MGDVLDRPPVQREVQTREEVAEGPLPTLKLSLSCSDLRRARGAGRRGSGGVRGHQNPRFFEGFAEGGHVIGDCRGDLVVEAESSRRLIGRQAIEAVHDLGSRVIGFHTTSGEYVGSGDKAHGPVSAEQQDLGA